MEYTLWQRGLRKFDRIMSKIETFLAVACITLCGFLILFGILNRVLIKMPLRWTEEACRMLLILTIFTAQPIVTREWAHLKLAFLSEALKGRKAARVLETIADISLVVIFAVIFWLFGTYTISAMEYHQVSPAMGYPMWVMYGICTLAFLDTVIRAVMVTIDDNFSKKKLFPRRGEDDDYAVT